MVFQSDQSPHCPHEERLGGVLPTERTVKTAQVDLSFCLSHTHFVVFVMSRLKICINDIKIARDKTTVLQAKGGSDFMFCLQVIRYLLSIDHLCINHIRRIGLIHK